MTPQEAYRRLNRLLWRGRLPHATIVVVRNRTMPYTHGVTMHDGIDLFMEPVICLNHRTPWGMTLVHEMLHVAEPKLKHGPLFNALVRHHWGIAKKNIKGIQKRRILTPTSEKIDPNVSY